MRENEIMVPVEPVEENAEMEVDMVELFYHLLEKWKLIALGAFVGAVLMAVYSLFIATPMYEATTKLYVLNNGDSAINLSDLQIGNQLNQDYQAIIKSRAVLNQVIEDLQLNTNYKALGNKIAVSSPNGTHIIRTSVTTNDLALSRDIANDLLLVSIDRIFQIVGTSEPTVIDYSEAEAVQDVTPSLTRYMIIGGLLGAIMAAAVFVFKVLMDRTLKTEEDVEKYLQLPVLSAVPYYND